MIVGIWGEDKSCKSTLALSAPKPIVVMEFDIGGFERVCRNLPNLPIKDWYDQGLIVLEQYPMPIQGIKIDARGNIIPQPSKIITGIKELFYQWLAAYFKHLRDPKINTVFVDTGTLLYNTIICDGYLQEKQEMQLAHINPTTGLDKENRPLRSQLQREEYREPYDRMRGICYQAKAHGKNLIMTHHAADEFKPMPQKDGTLAVSATGKRERHGWKQLGDSVDLMLHTFIKEELIPNDDKRAKPQFKRVPWCKVELASIQELVGMEYREPTLDMIDRVTKMIRGEA